MMYPYITLPDETEIVHSQIVTESGKQKVIDNFERGFDCVEESEQDLTLLGVRFQGIRGFLL